MSKKFYRMVFVSGDNQSVISSITNFIYSLDLEPQSISSMRSSHSVITMVTLNSDLDLTAEELSQKIKPFAIEKGIAFNMSEVYINESEFIKSDAFVRVFGEHKQQQIAKVARSFTDAGLDIHGIDSKKFDKNGKEVFVSNIKGKAKNGMEALYSVAMDLSQSNIEATVSTDYRLLA